MEEKMRSKFVALFTVVVLLSMVMTACQPAATAAPAPAATPQTVVQTVIVQQPGQNVVVTATPAPVQAVTFKSKDPTTFTYYTFGDVDNLDPAQIGRASCRERVFNWV